MKKSVNPLGIIITLSSVLFFELQEAKAGSLFRSVGREETPTTPAPAPKPIEGPDAPSIPEGALDRPISETHPDQESFDLFSEVAHTAMEQIDDRYSSYRELLNPRLVDSGNTVDTCDEALATPNTFGERISYYIYQHSKPRRPHVDVIASYYGISSSRERHSPVSLQSHPMCNVSKSSLTKTLKSSSRVPSSTVIAQMNEWVDRYNTYRAGALKGDTDSQVALLSHWSKFMGCLAYQESLTSADSSKSESVARKYAPSNYRKPAGVKFYEDPYQDEVSRLNIGLFQFTPNSSGNIGACVRHWNELYPSCKVSTKASRGDLIHHFGSGAQTMNAFCGVNKIVQSFAIQVNTSKSVSTHPDNQSGASMRPAASRCVSPFFYSGYSYNHFGPLMNSTGSNLAGLMACALK